MRVVIASWSGGGHAPPVKGLCSALTRAGHAVTVLAHADYGPLIEGAGADFIAYERAPNYESTTDRTPLADQLPVIMRDVYTSKDLGIDVANAIERLKPDVVAMENTLITAAFAAQAAGVSYVRMRNTLMMKVRRDALFGSGLLDAASQHFGFGSPPDFRKLKARATLVFTYRQFDNLEDAEPDAVHVGPMTLAPSVGSNWTRKEPKKPLLLVSLSTGFMEQVDVINRLCAALGELAVEALVTTGHAIAPSEIVAPANVEVLQHVDHNAVFPHLDFLVTHAGHGTVARALAQGVPTLCAPLGRDQFMIAKRVEDLGLGHVADAASNADVFREAIGGLMADHALHERCKAFAAQLADHPGPELAVETLEEAAA